MKIFLSYAREDEATAERLYGDLEQIPGVLPWMDKFELLPGDGWKQKIAEAMKSSRLVVLILSNNSVSKDGYVQHEVRDALDLSRNKPPGRSFLVPARIEYCEPKFPEILDLHWADFVGDWNQGLLRIRKLIEREQARDREIQLSADKVQNKKNRDHAEKLRLRIPEELANNLAAYCEWLWRHEYTIYPYSKAREAIPNWSKQASSDWLQHLYELGALDTADPETAKFTDVGLELVDLMWP